MQVDENLIVRLARDRIVTPTFRRLPPEKKDQVYQTAVALFGVYGYDGLAIDRFCRQAGISKGSFFQYFPSKTHLLEFTLLVFDDYLTRWLEEVRAHETAVLARDRILYLYHAIVVNSKLYRPERLFYLYAVAAANHGGVTIEGIDLERHFTGYVAEIIGRGVQTGEIRSDFEVELTSYLVSILIGGLAGRQYGRGGVAMKQTGEYLVSFLFDGIKA